MLEQRVAIFSSNLSLISLVMEVRRFRCPAHLVPIFHRFCFQCFLRYIRPLNWEHTYIPTLFLEIFNVFEYPGIFMIGCHSRLKSQVEMVKYRVHVRSFFHENVITKFLKIVNVK